jgi:proliferating cell nuclear antigen
MNLQGEETYLDTTVSRHSQFSITKKDDFSQNKT